MIVDNPFHRLGLPATASVRAIRRRTEELKLAIDLGRETTLTESDLTKARQELEDPLKRFELELTWLHVPDPLVDPNIDFHATEITPTIRSLRNAAGSTPCVQQAQALQALAVLLLGAHIAGSTEVDLQEALSCWSDVADSSHFWDYMSGRAHTADDPRLTQAVVNTLRTALPTRILESVSNIGASELERANVEKTKATTKAIRMSGFPPDAIEGACRRVTARPRSAIQSGFERVEKSIRQIPAAEGQSAKALSHIVEAEAILIADVLRPLAQLRGLDPTDANPELNDHAAEVTRHLCVRATYDPSGWLRAYQLISEAMSIAVTPTLVSKYAVDRAEVRASLHQYEAREAIARKQWLLAAANLELAADYETDDEYSDPLRARANGARSQGNLGSDEVQAEKAEIENDLRRATEHFRSRVQGTTTSNFIPRSAGKPQVMSSTAKSPAVDNASQKRQSDLFAWSVRGVLAAVACVAVLGLWLAVSGLPGNSNDQQPAAAASNLSEPPPETPPEPQKSNCEVQRDAAEARVDDLNATTSAEKERLRQLKKNYKRSERVIESEFPANTLSPSEYQRYLSYKNELDALVAKYNKLVNRYNRNLRHLHRYERRFTRLSNEC